MLSTAENFAAEPYMIVDNANIIKNHFNSLPYECPLNIHASKEQQMWINCINFQNDIQVSIIDMENNTETFLDSTTFYFTANKGENKGRFKVKFTSTKTSLHNVQNLDDNVVIYNNNNEVFVKGNNLRSIEVINTLGQIVFKKNN